LDIPSFGDRHFSADQTSCLRSLVLVQSPVPTCSTATAEVPPAPVMHPWAAHPGGSRKRMQANWI